MCAEREAKSKRSKRCPTLGQVTSRAQHPSFTHFRVTLLCDYHFVNINYSLKRMSFVFPLTSPPVLSDSLACLHLLLATSLSLSGPDSFSREHLPSCFCSYSLTMSIQWDLNYAAWSMKESRHQPMPCHAMPQIQALSSTTRLTWT